MCICGCSSPRCQIGPAPPDGFSLRLAGSVPRDGFIQWVVLFEARSPRSPGADGSLHSRRLHSSPLLHRSCSPFWFGISVHPQCGFGLQGQCDIELYVGAYPETCRCPVTQRCIAPFRPRLVGLAAPFRANLPSGRIAAPGFVLGHLSRHCSARHVGTCRPVLCWWSLLPDAGFLPCLYLCGWVVFSSFSGIWWSFLHWHHTVRIMLISLSSLLASYF